MLDIYFSLLCGCSIRRSGIIRFRFFWGCLWQAFRLFLYALESVRSHLLWYICHDLIHDRKIWNRLSEASLPVPYASSDLPQLEYTPCMRIFQYFIPDYAYSLSCASAWFGFSGNIRQYMNREYVGLFFHKTNRAAVYIKEYIDYIRLKIRIYIRRDKKSPESYHLIQDFL